MLYRKNSVFYEDLENILSDTAIPWKKLAGKTILVTGATGLIGSCIVRTLLWMEKYLKNPPYVLALVRDLEKAKKKFKCEMEAYGTNLCLVKGNVCSLPEIDGELDYIIHAASITSSYAFIKEPVEVIRVAALGTNNLINLGINKRVQGFIYFSSMEVYGMPQKGHAVTENEIAGFNPTVIRNSYPISKQMCESLCLSAGSEYGLPVYVLRLTQTFGPEAEYTDQRVFAEFMRCVLEKRDIVLKTSGLSERCYIYTADAVKAVFTVLLKGNRQEVYNVANPDTYCSIFEMANLVTRDIARGKISVKIEQEKDWKMQGYADTLFMQLDISKIKALGWKPETSLSEMFIRMLRGNMENDDNKRDTEN